MVIDAHTHLYDNSVAGAKENCQEWPLRATGAQGFLDQMDEAGVDRAFLISYTPVDIMAHFPPDIRDRQLATFQFYLTKEYVIRIWQQYPHRFFWFADSIDPRIPGYVARAEQDLDRGATGLKLLTGFVNMPINDRRWEPIFSLLSQRRRPCIIDLSYWYLDRPWFAPEMYGKYLSYEHFAEDMHQVAEQFPDVPMMIAHYGTPRLIDRDDPTREVHYDRLKGPIELIRPHNNLFVGLGAYQHVIAKDEGFPYWRGLRIVEILVTELGIDRVVWGTDWPYLGKQRYTDLVRSIREAPFLKADEVNKVLGGNALRFLSGYYLPE